jgi:heavy metal sensor kinase
LPLRLRLAAIFALATAAVLAVGGYFFVHQLQKGLVDSTDSTLQTRAAGIADALAQPAAKPVGLLEADRAAPLPLGGSEAQILDATGRVVSSTSASHRPMVSRARVERVTGHSTFFTGGGEAQRYILLRVTYTGQPLTVVVRSSLEGTDEASDRAERQLVFGAIPLTLLAGLAGWLLAGAALHPVERMRRQVASLSEDELGPTLDVPRTRDELASLAGTMNDLLDRVRRARRRERHFIAEAGHELRTPLAILQGELELALRPGREPEELRSALSIASGETQRLHRLAEDLLLLARGDVGELHLHLQPTHVADAARHAVTAAASHAQDLGVELVVRDEGGRVANLDPDRYRQALDNLIDNALRHSPRGSTVTVELRQVGGRAVCTVTDEGPGFPPAFLSQAMDRFSKAQGERGTGAGLGLAIVRSVATAHGGEAWVDNHPIRGAQAHIAVPSG